jgi:hypothetical protein
MNYFGKKPVSNITLRGSTFIIEDLEFTICKMFKGSQQTKDSYIFLENRSFKIANETLKKDFLGIFKCLIQELAKEHGLSIKKMFDFEEATNMSYKIYEQVRVDYKETLTTDKLKKVKLIMNTKLFFDF